MIVFIMGKSASGKDSIFREIARRFPNLKRIITYTTRPRREGEEEGREYRFVDKEGYERLLGQGQIIEKRSYPTVYGEWIYFTAREGIDPEKEDYLVIGTLEAYLSYAGYFGKDKLLPVMVELEDGERLLRAIRREKEEENPGYAEVCRRFLADLEDFSPEKVKEARIPERAIFENESFDSCLEAITGYIRENLKV